MDFEIIWSRFSESQLDEIFDYYLNVAGLKIATKIITEIIISTDILRSEPELGQIDLMLEDKIIRYRYLVQGNHKIIYSVDKENNFIKIADVFDTRQNPTKIKREKN